MWENIIENRAGILVCGVLLFVLIFEIVKHRRKINSMATIDNSRDDMVLLTEFIGALPQPIQDSIAAGTISMTIRWAEVTRDEDEWPTIKPVVEFKGMT